MIISAQSCLYILHLALCILITFFLWLKSVYLFDGHFEGNGKVFSVSEILKDRSVTQKNDAVSVSTYVPSLAQR